MTSQFQHIYGVFCGVAVVQNIVPEKYAQNVEYLYNFNYYVDKF